MPRDNVAIIYADFNPAQIIKLVTGSEAAQVITNGQHVIYSWLDARANPGDDAGPRTYAAIEHGRLITGKDKDRLNAALAVLDENAPNLSTSKALPEMTAAADTPSRPGQRPQVGFSRIQPERGPA